MQKICYSFCKILCANNSNSLEEFKSAANWNKEKDLILAFQHKSFTIKKNPQPVKREN